MTALVSMTTKAPTLTLQTKAKLFTMRTEKNNLKKLQYHENFNFAPEMFTSFLPTFVKWKKDNKIQKKNNNPKISKL